ncbi:MAG: GNAT family N-acetyltransferase [Micropruina sp.]|nr:MAG: GNAT family N-acetyltransferase [Micropruina sp.]
MLRPATPADIPDILRLVRDLATYEREPDAVTATEDDLRAALFPSGHEAKAFCEVAEVDGRVVGIALWFLNFSTWLGKHGIYLEDLYVEPAYRGHGIGKAFLVELARKCVANDWPRFQWWVLDWNAASIEFYRALGAEAQDEWTVMRVSGDALPRLAALGD